MKTILCFVILLIIFVNAYAQISVDTAAEQDWGKGEWGITFNVNQAATKYGVYDESHCTVCFPQKYNLVQKKPGIGQGIGIYYYHNTGKRTGINFGLDIYHLQSTFHYQSPYSREIITSADTVERYGVINYGGNFNLLCITPNLQFFIYLNKVNPDKYRFYLQLTLVPFFLPFKISKGAGYFLIDTIKTIHSGSASYNYSVITNQSPRQEIAGEALLYAGAGIGVGFRTPERHKIRLHFEISLQTFSGFSIYIDSLGNPPLPFDDNPYTLWHSLIFKAGVGF